ncbi:beta-ketoacyl synthase N-terminal-like domain-containing protein [Nocardia anaemiae]|uniref:beta-ketoacyl synthase N-terminal-like domain-containing protein n=1 Tax=Nocardia anaemiae TaxID=263910 RepID=UPI0007A4CCD1|nr:beta-ketoacyl synthase N-terminal-like domain-containing protein [Nocardia anaemiae]
MKRQPSVVTGVGLAINGLATAADLLRDPSERGRAEAPIDLSGREMRHKDRASRLALRAVERALADADLDSVAANATTATVVSSNYGNIDSACEFTDRIAEETTAGLSPLGLPHVSANAIAAWIAIRHRLRGPNLTLCNGGTSGIDALYWADDLITAGRADIAVVVGVEPDTPQVRRLLGADQDGAVFDGAAAVVMESNAHAEYRRATVRAVVGSRSRTMALSQVAAMIDVAARPRALWLTPTALPPDITAPIPTADLTGPLGDSSGALGVLQCVAAIDYLGTADTGPVYATCASGPHGDAATLQLLGPRISGNPTPDQE